MAVEVGGALRTVALGAGLGVAVTTMTGGLAFRLHPNKAASKSRHTGKAEKHLGKAWVTLGLGVGRDGHRLTHNWAENPPVLEDFKF
jgi:hypothetical protein